jgi:hypothetical protein
MAVHMKYHELEDEGTARAMPSAGVMGLLYHIVQIRPSLEDDYVVDQLMKLQTIKVKFQCGVIDYTVIFIPCGIRVHLMNHFIWSCGLPH